MPFARPNLTRPLPRPARRRPKRAVQQSGGTGAPLSLVLGGWNYLARIWISFDPPSTALPTWIEITGFAETGTAINIVHGRADGIGDVNATTCSLTVDNSDGRFCPDNSNGVWFGLIDLGCWLKVDVLAPSGNVFDRFVGFTNILPTGWAGQYASSAITASDRYEKLGQAPAIVSMIQSEVLTDPNLAGNVKAYWNLHEAQGSLTFGDTSGTGTRHLAATALGGVPAGTGLAPSNANAPGVEGLRCVTFNPPATTSGTYLTGPITTPPGTFNTLTLGYTGLYGTLEFWFQATTTGVKQVIAGLVDTAAQFGFTILINASGFLEFWTLSTAVGNTYTSSGLTYSTRVDDGAWHHIVIGVATTSAGGGAYAEQAIIDGTILGVNVGGASAGGAGNAISQVILGGGYDPYAAVTGTLSLGAVNISDASWSWADMAGAAASRTPNTADHYAAGTTGFLGESTDTRIARVARYAGVPIPLTAKTVLVRVAAQLATFGTVQVYNPGKGPWVNLAAGAHLCGTQSMAGRGPLDVMREAARTEFMPLFVDRSGYLAMQPSTVRQNTSPAWTVDARDLDPSTGLAKDFAYTTNQASITPNGQAAQTVIGPYGAASRARYGIYTQGGSLATASLNPVEAQSLGYAVVQQRSKPLSRLAPLVVEAATLATQPGYGTAWYDAVLTSEISTPAEVTNTPPQMGGGTSDVLLEGWTETLAAGTHTLSYSTSPIQGQTYQLNSATLGVLDTAGITLAY